MPRHPLVVQPPYLLLAFHQMLPLCTTALVPPAAGEAAATQLPLSSPEVSHGSVPAITCPAVSSHGLYLVHLCVSYMQFLGFILSIFPQYVRLLLVALLSKKNKLFCCSCRFIELAKRFTALICAGQETQQLMTGNQFLAASKASATRLNFEKFIYQHLGRKTQQICNKSNSRVPKITSTTLDRTVRNLCLLSYCVKHLQNYLSA